MTGIDGVAETAGAAVAIRRGGWLTGVVAAGGFSCFGGSGSSRAVNGGSSGGDSGGVSQDPANNAA